MLTSELRTKLYEYRELRAKIAELKEAMEQVEDAIKAHMGDREELMVDGTKIRWTTYTANRLDAAALRDQEQAEKKSPVKEKTVPEKRPGRPSLFIGRAV